MNRKIKTAICIVFSILFSGCPLKDDVESSSSSSARAENRKPSVGDFVLTVPIAGEHVEGLLGSYIEQGLDVNGEDHAGYPFLCSLIHMDDEYIREALRAGANPNIVCENGRTFLSNLGMFGEAETVKLAIKQGANPNAISPRFSEPVICHFVYFASDERLEAILKGGANPNVNCQGDIVPALSLAARYESHVSIMVRYGAQIYGQDKEHTSILCYFSNGWDYQALGVFLRKGADPNTICQKGIPFLLKVAMFGTKEQITTVIFYEPKDTPLPNGCTAVDMVLKRRETRSVEELEAKGYRASADYLCTESFTQVVEQTFH